VERTTEHPRLGHLLVRAGVLDPGSLTKGLAEHERTGRPLGMTLVELGFVSEQTLVSTLAHQLGLPVARIAAWPVTAELRELVPAELAERHRCIPLGLKDEGSRRSLYLAMADPSDLEALEAVHAATGRDVRIVLVAPSELDAALARTYRGVESEADRRPLRDPDDPEYLHHWSVSREELLALLADDPPVAEPAAPAPTAGRVAAAVPAAAAADTRAVPAAAAADTRAVLAAAAADTRAVLDRRRLEELDRMVKLVMQLLVEGGVVSRDELVRRLSALLHERS
jgi:hypothetical protein